MAIDMKRLTLFGLVGLFAALLLLAACGGDDDDGGEVEAEPEVTADQGGSPEENGEQPTEGEAEPTADEGEPAEDEGNGSEDVEEINVCELVSKEEAEATLGRPVLDGVPSTADFTEFSCDWNAVDDFGTMTVRVWTDPARFTEYYELAEGEPVEGVGNEAKWDDTQGLEVLTDEYYIGVFTVNFSLTDEERQARSVTLAQTVIGRLE